MWTVWSRHWIRFAGRMFRWYLGSDRPIALPDATLCTRLGPDGTRWAIVRSPQNNIIHLRRRGPRNQSASAAQAKLHNNNVLPFVSGYLRRARVY